MSHQSEILVSIIVPAFNVEKYIEKCLDSLMNQTLESIEIICVNDGSTDSTPQKLDAIASSCPKVKIVNRENGGLSAARNSGLAVAQGKYIGFVDGDDWADKKMFEGLVEALERNHSSELAVCGVETIFMYNEKKDKKIGYDNYFKLDRQGEYKINQTTFSLNKPCWNKLYRKDFLDRNQIRFPEGMNNEDEVFSYFVFSRASHITYVNQKWYKYMRYGTGIISDQEKEFQANQKLPDYLTKVWPLLIEFIKRDSQYNLLNDMIAGLLGKNSSFRCDISEKTTSTLLHRLDFPKFADIIDSNPQSEVRQELQRLYDLNTIVDLSTPDCSLLPKPVQPKECKLQPKFSFVIPVYNSSKYLYKCVESLRNQTFEDIEMIFVNDGSTDDSEAILRKYADIDRRIQIISQSNQGAFIARKVGSLKACGEYVIFVDPDDWINLETCEYINRFINLYDVDIVQYGIKLEHCGNFSMDYIEGVQNFLNRKANITDGNNITLLRSCFIGDGILWNNCGKAIRADIIKLAFAQMPEIKCNFAEDQIAMFYILSYSKSIKSIEESFYHYRYGTGISTMQKENVEDFKVKLKCFNLFKEAESFAQKFFDAQKQEDVNEVLSSIHYSMMENMWKRIVENTNADDKKEWLTLLCEMVGIYEMVSFVNKLNVSGGQSSPKDGNKDKEYDRYKRKNKKHLRAIRLLIVLSIVLLLSNILFAVACFM